MMVILELWNTGIMELLLDHSFKNELFHVPSFSFPLKRFNQTDETVFKFIVKFVQSLILLFCYLVGPPKTLIAGTKFSA